jgi:hypothetical protein
MRTASALPTRSLALVLLVASSACGGGDSGRPGLILSKSIFDAQGNPTPATLVLMRAPASGGGEEPAEWLEETIVASAGEVELQTGSYDGQVVFRRVAAGPDGAAQGQGAVVDLVAQAGGWVLNDRADVTPDQVTWDTRKDGSPTTKLYEVAGGNVFHKAMWWDPLHGEPGILTISANMPYLQVWRAAAGGWAPETLWTAEVGGKEQRFRDVEIGDVDGDGSDELVVVTHDLGAIFVLEQAPEGLQATKVHDLEERTFVHEVEICDVDGDGRLEFLTTPSEPNKLDGHSEQGGGIDLFRYDPASGEYRRSAAAHWEDRHAKEILGYDYDADGRAEVYAAVEGGGLTIQVLRWDDAAGAMVEAEGVDLEGEMCRFLSGGDTNGDGVREIVASTRDGGVFALSSADGTWTADKIVPPFASGGFEHATLLMDWDGDGADDLFIASDNQKRVQRVYFDGSAGGEGRYRREKLIDLRGRSQFITWNVMELPAGR